MTANLATFVDRYTMRHVRVFPHPIERVWRAITDDTEFSQWFGFDVTFDMRVGGKCVWGTKQHYFDTEISRFEPITLVEHIAPGDMSPDRGYMRFELQPTGDGCRFDFTQRFEPGLPQQYEEDRLGAELPGGPDTPWRPGFVGGFHTAWDNLSNYLNGLPIDAGREPRDELFGRLVDEWLWRKRLEGEFTPDQCERYAKELRGVAAWNDLNEIYKEHIRDTIPAD